MHVSVSVFAYVFIHMHLLMNMHGHVPMGRILTSWHIHASHRVSCAKLTALRQRVAAICEASMKMHKSGPWRDRKQHPLKSQAPGGRCSPPCQLAMLETMSTRKNESERNTPQFKKRAQHGPDKKLEMSVHTWRPHRTKTNIELRVTNSQKTLLVFLYKPPAV